MAYEELNTGEPVAWMQTFTQEYWGVREIKNAVNIERIGINDSALYSQDYVTQLLGEIEGLKSKLNKTDALIDQAYSNGAGAGFNCDTHEDLAKIRESRSGYLKVLKIN